MPMMINYPKGTCRKPQVGSSARSTLSGCCNCTTCRKAGELRDTGEGRCRGRRGCRCKECKKSKFFGIIGRGDIPALASHLKKNPESVNSPTGIPPLFYAIGKNRPEIVKMLVHHGADTVGCYGTVQRRLNGLIIPGCPAFYAALMPIVVHESAIALVDTADLTLKLASHHGSVWNAIIEGCYLYKDGNYLDEELLIELLRLVLERKAGGTPCPGIDEGDDKGFTALRTAALRGLPDTTRFLLRMGANAYNLADDSRSLFNNLADDSYHLSYRGRGKYYAGSYPVLYMLQSIFECGSEAIKRSHFGPITLVSQQRISRRHPYLKKIGKYTWKHILQFALEPAERQYYQFPKTDFELGVASGAIRDMLKPPSPPSPKNFYTVNPLHK